MRLVRLAHSEIEWTEWGATTRFADGSEAHTWPHSQDAHYVVASHRAGHGDDVLAYARFHDAAHLFVEESLHDRPSLVLWAVAHDKPLSGPASAYEEAMAQTFQRWVFASEEPLISGVDWHGLKREFLGLFEGWGDNERRGSSSLSSF